MKYKLAINFYLTIILLLSLGYPLGHVLAITTVGTNISTGGSLTTNGALQFTNGAANNYILSTDASGNATWISVGSALSNVGLGTGSANGIAPLDASSQVPMSNLPVGVPGGIATLDAGGLVPTAQLPSIAITNTYVVSSQELMLALSAHQGDVAVRTDINQTFILSTNDPTALSDWIQVLSPTGGTLLASNNLSDLTNPATARTSLGLGNVANVDTTNASNISSGALDLARITAGSNGDVLTTSGGAVTWASPSAVVETDPYSIHLDQTTAQTFTAGAVTGSGLLKVTSGLLGLDTNTYITSSALGDWNSKLYPVNAAGVLTNNGSGTLSWSPASGATNFISLSDVPSSYASANVGDLLRINAGKTGLEFFTPSYLTSFSGLTALNVTNALTFTPYNATNPSGYQTAGDVSTYVTGLGYITSSALTPYSTTAQANLLYYPLSTNPANYLTSASLSSYATQAYVTSQGYITGINSGNVITALGFTPYNATNPSGYITSSALGDWNSKLYPVNAAGVLTNNGSGTLSWSATGAETDPVVKAINGLVKSNGTTISAATAGTDYLASVVADSPLSGAGTSASHLTVNLSSKQNVAANLTSLSGLTWSSGSPLIKMTAAGTFALDTNTYLTSYTETDPLSVLKVTYTTNGDLIYGTGAGTYSRLGGSAGFLKSTGAVAPTWSAISLTADVTGTLSTSNGGTGIADSYTVGDMLYASGAGTLSKLADVATGSCLRSGGVGVAPTWGSCAASASGIPNNVKNSTGTAAVVLTTSEQQVTTVAIAPTSTSNRVIITGFQQFDKSSTTVTTDTIRVRRGGTSCTTGSPVQVGVDVNTNSKGAATDKNVGSFSFVDSPSTTSATTYRVCVIASAATSTATNYSIVVTEVGP